MKVLHLEFGRHVYGGALQVAFLIGGLSELESTIENHLVVPEESELPDHLPEGLDTPVHRLPIGGEADFRVYFRLKHLIRDIRPDILHIHSRRGADLWGILAARRLRIPYLLTRRVDNADARWLTRWRTRKAAFVVGISERICDVMREQGTDPEKVHCIRSTVDIEKYQPSGDRALLEEIAGIGPENLAVAIIAQLIERKGHHILFEAVPDILEAFPKAVFLIFGRGPEEEALRNIVKSSPWGGQVRFMGFRNDLEQIIPSLDLVVHPAFMEGLGVALLQASACGVPIVASRAGGIPEVVHDGQNGLLVEPGKAQALAAAVKTLLGDPERRTAMSNAGRKLAEEAFSISRMSRDYKALYGKMAQLT